GWGRRGREERAFGDDTACHNSPDVNPPRAAVSRPLPLELVGLTACPAPWPGRSVPAQINGATACKHHKRWANLDKRCGIHLAHEFLILRARILCCSTKIRRPVRFHIE